jgi:DNA repair ATPase RecN
MQKRIDMMKLAYDELREENRRLNELPQLVTVRELLDQVNDLKVSLKQASDLLAWYEDVFADPPIRK